MTFAAPGLRGWDRRGIWFGVLGAAAAGAVGYEYHRHTRLISVGLLLPIVVLLLRYPKVSGGLAIAALPFPNSFTGDSGLALSASDILMILACLNVGVHLVLGRPDAWAQFRGIKTLGPIFAIYFALLVLNVAEHPKQDVVVGLVQRVELIGLPLIVGGIVLDARSRLLALRGFVLSAAFLALATIVERHAALGVQKNPAGGFMACALLILLLRPEIRFQARLLAPLLAVGLIIGQSRGALVGLLLAGGIVILSRGGGRTAVLKRLMPLVLILGLAISSAPDSVKHRLTHTNAADDRAVLIRQEYVADAKLIIGAHRLEGVGINNYLAGRGETQTADPHQVIYAETAEGGYPLTAGLLVLLVGASFFLVRRRRDPWALLALSVQVATIGHAFTDVYWVRATPTLGWFLTGQLSHSRLPTSRTEIAAPVNSLETV